MRKADLNNGDIVLTRDGEKHIFLKNAKGVRGTNDAFISLRNGCYLVLDDYDNDLECCFGGFDIIKVCSNRYVGDNIRDHIINDREHWTWEREEVKEMTVDEISEKLGYKVKVVGEDR